MEEEAKNAKYSETPQEENPKDTINNVHGSDAAAKEQEEEEEEEEEDAGQEKSVIPVANRQKNKVSSAPKVAFADPIENSSGESVDRDSFLARVATEKRLVLIKAWEESEKTKAENKAYKKLLAVEAREINKKAAVEAKLKEFEEKLEKKKAEYAERMRNKMADVHKAAGEKQAAVEAKRGEDFVKIVETANNFRSRGYVPKKSLGCFSGWRQVCHAKMHNPCNKKEKMDLLP